MGLQAVRDRSLHAPLLALTAVMAAWGCGSAQAPAPRGASVIFADGPAPPGAFISTSARFRLDPFGFRLITGEAARALNSDIEVTGTNDDTGSSAAVLVEAMSPITVDAFTELVIKAIRLDEVFVERQESLEYHGLPALQTVLHGKLGGTPTGAVLLTFLHQGHGYQLLVMGPDVYAGSPEAARFFGAFHLIEGPIALVHDLPEAPPLDGARFSIEDGVFTCAWSGFRVTSGEAFVVGQLMSAGEPGRSDLEIQARAFDVSIDFDIVPTPDRHHARIIASYAPSATGSELALNLDGIPLTGSASSPLNVLEGVRCSDGYCLEVTLHYPSGQDARVRELLEQAGPRISRVAPSERAGHGRSLESFLDVNLATSADGFTDLELGLQMGSLPRSGRFCVGPCATATAADGRVRWQDLATGLELDLSSTPLEPTDRRSPAELHEDYIAGFELPTPVPDKTRLALGEAQVEAWSTEIEYESPAEVPRRARVVSFVSAGHLVAIELFGFEEVFVAQRPLIEKILGAIEVAPSVPAVLEASRLVSPTFAVELRVPGEGWRSERTNVPGATGAIFRRGNEMVGFSLTYQFDRGDPASLEAQFALQLGRLLGPRYVEGAPVEVSGIRMRTLRNPAKPGSIVAFRTHDSVVTSIGVEVEEGAEAFLRSITLVPLERQRAAPRPSGGSSAGLRAALSAR